MKSNKPNKTKTSNIKILEKTKNQLGTKYFYIFILTIGAILIFIAPLIHFPFPNKNPKIENFKTQLNNKILDYESSLSDLRTNYNKNRISAENYIMQSDKVRKNILDQEKINKQLLSKKINESRVLGWLTIKTFLVGFGIRVPYLFFSLLISFLIYKINTNEKELQFTFVFLQIACYTIALYELVWCFWYSQDYPLYMYKWIVIGLSGLVATSVVYFISYREVFTTRLQKIVNVFSTLSIIIAPEYMDKEQKQKFKKRYINELEKGAE